MFAIVEISGSQLKVEPDSIVKAPPIKGNVGDTLEYSSVLMFQKDSEVKIGQPYIDEAKVKVEIFAQDRGKKQFARVYKRRKRYKKSWGFRVPSTLLKVTDISS